MYNYFQFLKKKIRCTLGNGKSYTAVYHISESINVDMGADGRETTFSQNIPNRNKQKSVCVRKREREGEASQRKPGPQESQNVLQCKALPLIINKIRKIPSLILMKSIFSKKNMVLISSALLITSLWSSQLVNFFLTSHHLQQVCFQNALAYRKYKVVVPKHPLEMWLRKDFKGSCR